MNEFTYKILEKLHIIERCPNCASAWTGGCLEPENRQFCILCGIGPRGWLWSKWLVPGFIQSRMIRHRIKLVKAIEEDLKCHYRLVPKRNIFGDPRI